MAEASDSHLDSQVNESQLKMTEFAKKELIEFHERHFQVINHMMGFIVQSKNLAELVSN
jgi:hypothetical protein